MPRYNHKAADSQLLPVGTYDAVVKRAEEKLSEAGNEMIELILTCYGPNGLENDVFDYLVFSNNVLYKVKHFCESAGINFEKDELTADECVDQNVRVKLKIDKREGYKDKNAVTDYVERTGAPAIGGLQKPRDEDVPF